MLTMTHPRRVRRQAMLALLVASVVWLLPWTIYLGRSLPDQHDTHQWRLAWTGFDAVLLGSFAGSAWLSWRRSRFGLPALTATATLMLCDAWFDVTLDWSTPDRWNSLLTAVLAEVPLAILLLLQARMLLAGGTGRRQISAGDITGVLADPWIHRVAQQLDRSAPADIRTLAQELDVEPVAVGGALTSLAEFGWARKVGRDRWEPAPLDLRIPDLPDIPEADRPTIGRWLDAKLDSELRLFAQAFRHPQRMGPWAKGARGTANLTQAELTRFTEEYLELAARYGLLHPRPHGATRKVALRFYAFPTSFVKDVADSHSARPESGATHAADT
ncbi:hypothetical protein [Frankia sp. AvcI1]|uniref:hypothetical protein n=2 Tax=Frankia sp. AvcI1 TaxID=573496 RepID=UPI002117C809|nr:hypothetical protein [Frankia sp. AvcI1]